mgnify:CR=1 FL=1
MKEKYFTLENVAKKSEEWLHDLIEFRKKRKIIYNPKNSALLIIDLQNYFFENSSHAYIPSAPAIVPKVKKLMEAYLKNNLPVIFTRHIDEQKNESPMSEWWEDSIQEGDNLSEIIPELSHPQAIFIKKSQYDAFYQTPLETLLKEKAIKQVVVTGVMTHLCCETTARSAFMRGFMVFFPVDGTATYNENFHRSTLLNLAHGFAIPVLCKELLAALENLNG